MQVLRGVVDPELGSDIVDLGMVRSVELDGTGHVLVTIALTTAGCPLRAQIQRDIRVRVGSLEGVTKVDLRWDEMTDDERTSVMAKARWNITQRPEHTSVPLTANVILVASGKGGVGKSSVTVNLAAALAAKGMTVGVLDADIWGFSVPRMLGVEGLLVDDEETALMWRGLMLNRGVQHFLQDVWWGDDLDYLLIDMPPGTGDVQMGVAKLLPRSEVLVVTTPARAAQKVAVRVVGMARKSFLRVAGVIENMSSFRGKDGEEYALFGSGGGAELAHDAGVPLLGTVPLEPAVSAGGDEGEPVVLLGEGRAAEAFQAIADRIVDEAIPPSAMAGCSARMLDAAVAALDNAEL